MKPNTIYDKRFDRLGTRYKRAPARSMKKIIIITLLIFVAIKGNSQNWQWAAQMGGTDSEAVGNTCVDSMNNLYLTGGFSYNSIIGSDTLLSGSNRSGFVAKVTADGDVVWGKKVEGYEITNGYRPGSRVYYDQHDGSLLVTSRMSGPDQAIGDCVLFANGQMGQNKNYITNLDTDGNCNWTINLDDVFVMNLTSDGVGNFYTIVRTSSSGSTLDGNFLSAGIYLVKQRSQNGSVVWTKKVLSQDLSAVKIEYEYENLWIGGNTGTDTNFMLDTVEMIIHPYDIFVSKFDTAGTLEWFEVFGGEGIEALSHAGVDSENNAYLSGFITSDTYFGDSLLTTATGNDIYLMKLGEDGEQVWISQSTASDEISYYNGVTDDAGNSVLVGKFTGTVTFDAYSLTSIGGENGFVVKYDSTGNCVGAKTIENIGWSSLEPAIDIDGNTLVAGGFVGVTDFDGNILTSNSGSDDAFVAKIDLKTGVPEARLDGSSELFIYANPNEGKCTIDVPDDFLYEHNLVLRIFDTSGKLIRQTPLNMNHGRIQLSLEQEAKGIYTATLSNSEKSYHGRIVFE